MLQNAPQFAVSYPFVRCHDSQVVKKKVLFIACKWRREEWKRKQKTCSQFATRLLLPPLHRIWLYCFCEQFWLHDRWQETSMFSSTPQMLIFFADSSAAAAVVLVANMTVCVRSVLAKASASRPVRLISFAWFLDWPVNILRREWNGFKVFPKCFSDRNYMDLGYTFFYLFVIMLLGCFVAPRTPMESSILQHRHLILNINWIPMTCCHLFAPSL